MNTVCATAEKSSLEILALGATFAVPFIAIAAIVVAVLQIKSNAKVVRKASAYSIYHSYLKLAMENPDLAYGSELAIASNAELMKRYKWFVATMLLSFEEIMATCSGETDWKAAMLSQLRRHAWHLSVSSSVQKGHWRADLMLLIEQAIAEGRKSVLSDNYLQPTQKYLVVRMQA